jgi:4-amino-4-deoxy-L-arabinose transferase-like glycosyltransferase
MLFVPGFLLAVHAGMIARHKPPYYLVASVIGAASILALLAHVMGGRTHWVILAALVQFGGSWIMPEWILIAGACGLTLGLAWAHLHLRDIDLNDSAMSDICLAVLVLAGATLAASDQTCTEDAVAVAAFIVFAAWLRGG